MLPDIWARVCVARYTIDTGEKKGYPMGRIHTYSYLPTIIVFPQIAFH